MRLNLKKTASVLLVTFPMLLTCIAILRVFVPAIIKIIISGDAPGYGETYMEGIPFVFVPASFISFIWMLISTAYFPFMSSYFLLPLIYIVILLIPFFVIPVVLGGLNIMFVIVFTVVSTIIFMVYLLYVLATDENI